MDIVIISDDGLFSLGVVECLKNDHNIISINDYAEFVFSDLEKLALVNADFVFIAFHSKNYFMNVMCEVGPLKARVVVFFDSNDCHVDCSTLYFYCASKKIALKDLPGVMENARNYTDITLTKRQEAVFLFVMRGFSNVDISVILDISEKTVSAHKINALRKFGLNRINQFGGVSLFCYNESRKHGQNPSTSRSVVDHHKNQLY